MIMGISRKYTHEEFLKLFNKKSNGEYECLSIYNGMFEPIKVKHLKKDCKYNIFSTTPSRFIHQGSGCPICYGRRNMSSEEEFEKKLQERMGTQYSVEGHYHGALQPIKIRHYINDETSHVFETTPQRIYNLKQGCTICFGRMTAEKFRKKVKERYGDEYTLLTEWKGGKEPITFRHNSKDCDFSISTRIAAEFMSKSRPRTCRTCTKLRKKKTVR